MWSGLESPARVWGFVERLLNEPWSRWRAKKVGGDQWREHLGWSPDTYLQAVLIDAVQANTAVTAAHGSGKRPKTPPTVQRPRMRPSQAMEALEAGDSDREWTAAELEQAQAELNS